VIGQALAFLRQHASGVLASEFSAPGEDAEAEKVVLPDGDKPELGFPLGAVSLLLVNLEEERVLRAADRYARVAEDGSPERAQPDLHLILYLLFVARFKAYDVAWEHLSRLIEHFQSSPLFEPQTAPGLPGGVEKLGLELVTLRFNEQNELWSTLRCGHHPSVLYRVKLIALRDRRPQPRTRVDELVLRLRGVS
jgi:hypothetical protein